MSPLKKAKEAIIALVLLVIILPQSVNPDLSAIRPSRMRTARVERVMRNRNEDYLR